MPRTTYTEIICIVDRSGSMSSIKDDAIGGFNSFLESQKKLTGTASLSLVLFDHEYLSPFHQRDIRSVEPLTNMTFVPRGQTALFDAIGRTINEVGTRLATTPEPERPEKVLVCIVTDGEENSSRRFSRPQIKDMIQHQRSKYSWEFAFLAANQDAFSEAESMGISANMAMNFEATPAGTRIACSRLNDMVSDYRANSAFLAPMNVGHDSVIDDPFEKL